MINIKPLVIKMDELGIFPDDEQSSIRFQSLIVAMFSHVSLQETVVFTQLIELYNNLQYTLEELELAKEILGLLQHQN